MEIPICAGTSTRSCNSLMPTFIAVIKVSQHALGQVLKGNPSPSPIFAQFPMIFFFSGRRRALLAEESVECCWDTAELLPWLLDAPGHTTRFSHLRASHRLSSDFQTIVFCLQRGDSAFLLCRRACSQGFLALGSSPPNHFFCDLSALFEIIFHCVYHFFFILAPTDYHLLLRLSQACLPPSISCRGRRILSLWCSFVPPGPLRHQEAHVVRAESLKHVSPSFVSCFFQDSPEIHINIFWSQETFQFFNPHLHTVTSFQILFRSCDDCSFSRTPSSSFLFVTSLLPLKGGVRILHRCRRCHPSS